MDGVSRIWIEHLDDGLAPSIKYLYINAYIEFNDLPEVPITEQPFHWLEQKYQEFALVKDDDKAVYGEIDKSGEREIKWLQYPYNRCYEDKSTAREDALSDNVFDLKPFWENSGTGALVGLGKDNLRSLVAAYNYTQCQPRSTFKAIEDYREEALNEALPETGDSKHVGIFERCIE
ncbi:MAG: hypothetical protein Q9180_000259 [Flavoplaca navasiana]